MNTQQKNWIFQDQEVNTELLPEGSIGFVYLIENIQNGKKYIGKKNLFSNKISVKTVIIKSGPNKGTKKKKRTKIPIFSDWQDYYGSSEILKKEISEIGSENYTRTILRFCKSKAEMSYYEAKEQFSRDVLLSDEYYNMWISVRTHKMHVFNKV